MKKKRDLYNASATMSKMCFTNDAYVHMQIIQKDKMYHDGAN